MKKSTFGTLFTLAIGLSSIGWAQQNLKTKDFGDKLAATPQAQVLDVRTPEEYSEGHLKNAKNIDIQNAQFTRNIQALDKNKPVFVYCLAGGRSSKAMDVLVKQGFTQVYNLEGGYMKWSLNGQPTEGVAPAKADEVPVARFDQMVKNHPLVLVDFNAKWCGPCKKLLPIVEKLESDYGSKLLVVKIDVDKSKGLVKQKGVEALPALMLYKNSQIVWQQEGATDEKTLRRVIDGQL